MSLGAAGFRNQPYLHVKRSRSGWTVEKTNSTNNYANRRDIRMPILAAGYLKKLNVRLLEQVGVAPEVAEAVSDCIVQNCLYGHDSHAMTLIPRFIKDVESGKIKPEAKTEIIKQSPCWALLDGHRGFGQLSLTDAMRTAMDMAQNTGIAAVTLTNANHVGIMWTFCQMPAENGMIGMIWCVSGPEGGGGLVAPHGGKKKAIGANPIGVGIPAGRMKPLILDMSTSAAAGGTVLLYGQQGKRLPKGWLLDQQGNPTTDPNELLKGGQLVGHLLPMAGHKGFGLGLIAEILGGLLTGYGASHMDYREGQGVFAIVIDVKQFIDLDEFGRQTDALFRHVKSVPTDSETEEILIPGELEYRTREERERNGIPVTDALWSDITAHVKRLGISVEEL